MWKIGDVEIDNRVVVAPMAGVSNAAFRTIVKEQGAGLVVCEMISDKALLFHNPKTLKMLHIEPEEYPLSIQILGGETKTMVEAAKYIAKNTDAAIIDINMGCPVPKVTNNESGSKFLKNPDHIYEVVSQVVDAVDKPVTVKMRCGWDKAHYYPVETALAAQKAGAKMIAMHGRTREQMYRGQADWNILKKVREALSIPFVANGDIRTPIDAKNALEITGADAVMVGRAALGNPWVIHQMVHYLETGEMLADPSPAEKISQAIDHLNRLIQLKGEEVAVKEFRKLSSYYLKGLPGSAKYKETLHTQVEAIPMIQLLKQCGSEAQERLDLRQYQLNHKNEE
ncbi:tRNA dihydrouridine synthase DusB [Allofustis seminis]|uniref:tRNA dihydrouridine synthase DusB n=1 Tax=Allofustis seminis TaxID=166939 RepID=UPI000370A98A|nr:tRNA dihydrouridine synthase DusB [Allofustis seminis]